MPTLPLDIVTGEDVVTTIEAVVREEIARPRVRELIMVLGRGHTTYDSERTLRRLVSALRRIDGVAPIVLPPPSTQSSSAVD